MSNTWKIFYTEGSEYWNVAVKSARRPEIFNAEVLYNIVSMAIEKFFMALLVYHGTMPNNHTLTDLVEAVKNILDVDSVLEERLKYMDSLQEICAIHSIIVKKITENDRAYFLETGQMVHNFVNADLSDVI